MRCVLPRLAAALLVLAAFGPATAQTGPASMGPLEPFLSLGPDEEGLWHGAVEGDAYVLSNERDPGAVTYFYLDPQEGMPTVSVDVDVAPGADPAAGAGLLFAFDPQQGTYYAFTLQADDQVALYRRDAEGFQQVAQTGSDAVRPKGPNTLTVAGRPGEIELLVNGESMVTIEPAGPVGQGIGILALGRGRFTFADFALDGPSGPRPAKPVVAPQPGPVEPPVTPQPGPILPMQTAGPCGDPGADYLLAAWQGMVIPPYSQLRPGLDWVPFMDPNLSYTFFHPPGWQAMPVMQINDAAMTRTTGFQLVSPDGSAMLAMIDGFNVPAGSSRDVAQQGLGQVIGNGGTVLCVLDKQIPSPFPTTESFVAAADGTTVAVAVGRVTVETGMGMAMTNLVTYSGPRQAFADLVGGVYLPILGQMLGGGCVPDGTGDGDDDDNDGDSDDDDEC